MFEIQSTYDISAVALPYVVKILTNKRNEKSRMLFADIRLIMPKKIPAGLYPRLIFPTVPSRPSPVDALQHV